MRDMKARECVKRGEFLSISHLLSTLLSLDRLEILEGESEGRLHVHVLLLRSYHLESENYNVHLTKISDFEKNKTTVPCTQGKTPSHGPNRGRCH